MLVPCLFSALAPAGWFKFLSLSPILLRTSYDIKSSPPIPSYPSSSFWDIEAIRYNSMWSKLIILLSIGLLPSSRLSFINLWFSFDW
jgi:hypothetical protein